MRFAVGPTKMKTLYRKRLPSPQERQDMRQTRSFPQPVSRFSTNAAIQYFLLSPGKHSAALPHHAPCWMP